MQKRGQFYIIAAVMIISLIYGLTIVENKASGTSNSGRFYDLSSNFERESVKIVDSGVYSRDSQGSIEKKLYDFYRNYTQYALTKDSGISMVFVYGDRVRAVVARLNPEESTTHIFGLQDESNAISSKTNVLEIPSLDSVSGENVSVVINGEKKEFNLKDNENFYFIMVSQKDKEVLVSENA